MARTVRDAKLETRAARYRLAPGKTPHWKTLVPSRLHLGYRRKDRNEPGQWLVRHYLGKERYHVAPLGIADDFEDDDEFLTFAAAQRMAHDHRIARRSGRGPSVADAVAHYVSWLRPERPTTADNTERTADLLILPRLGRIKLADLTTKNIHDWCDALAREPARVRTRRGAPQGFRSGPPSTKEEHRVRRATTNRVLTILKAALNRAFKDGLATDDLAWRRAEPFKKVHAARPGFLTVEESRRLINAADPEFRVLVQAALLTGCRYGELGALQVRDFQRGKLYIRDSKSGKPRDVVLTDEGIAFFSQLAAGRPGSDPMLKRHWQKSAQALPMIAACRAARIVPVVGFHQLRHTWASLSVMNGMPLMVVARGLGHADTRMVERHYGHLTENYIDKMVRDSAPTFGFVADEKITVLR